MKPIILSLLIVLLSVCLPLVGQADKAAVNTDVLKAGMARIDITPDLSVKLFGYAARKLPSTGIHDHLFARATVFESGGKRILMISTDIGAYPDTVITVFRKSLAERFNIKDSELFLAAIHSHSAPVVTFDPVKVDPNNVQYTKWLQQKLIEVTGEAIKNMKPVVCGAGRGYSPVGANRRETSADGSVVLGRNPYGITDKEVLVLKLASPDGKPVGAIYDYATHATSLGPGNLLISGDVLGLSEQFVEQILGPEVITPVFVGASGNIDPWYRILPAFNTTNGWIPEPVLLGTLLGEEVVHVFNDIKDLQPGGVISSSTETIQYPRRKIDDKEKAQPSPEQDKPVPVTITAAHIGNDVAFISFSVEMLTDIGMAIKAGSPYKYTFVISHCNGASGYLVPAELYKEGGYEATVTKFAIGTDKEVVKKALRMLYDLK